MKQSLTLNFMKLIKKSYLSALFFIFYFVALRVLFNNNNIYNIFTVALNSSSNNIYLGYWRNPKLELLGFLIVQIIVYYSALVSINRFTINSKRKSFRLIAYIVVTDIIINIVFFFIFGTASQLNNPYLSVLSNILFSIILLLAFTFIINGKINTILNVKRSFIYLILVFIGLAAVYTVIIGLLNKSINQTTFIEGNLFMSLDKMYQIINIEMPTWHEAFLIIIMQ